MMKKRLSFMVKISVCLILFTVGLGQALVTQIMAQGPQPVQLGSFSGFVGAGLEVSSTSSASSQLLANPGFEGGGWLPWEIFGAPMLDGSINHSGSKSAHLGNTNNANDQIIQTVAIPTNASAVTLDFWYNLATTETNLDADFFCYGLWNQSGTTTFIEHCLDLGATGSQTWSRETYNLTAAERARVVGQTAMMAFILQTNDSQTSRVWVDDAALPVTTPGPETNHLVYLPVIAKAPSPPTILSFSANPATIAPGGTSVLSWQVSGATSLSISPGIGPVIGSSVNVSPAATTQYTLTASNTTGSTTAQTTVNVSSGGGSGANAFWLPYTSATGDLLPTYGTSVAVDSAGGVHVGYAIYSDLDNGQRPAYYTYCPANCTNPTSWTRIRLSDFVQDVRLGLDPAGRPRMLFYTSNNPNLSENIHKYQYAVCDSGCTNAANWTIAAVASVNEIPSGRSLQNNRYFALDPDGRPAFLFSHPIEGVVYAYCFSDCTNAANWGAVPLVSNQWPSKLALAFTPTGDPRLLVDYYDSDNVRTRLLFIGCDTLACENSTGRFLVTNTASGLPASIGDAYFSLRLTTNGQPRVALYTGEIVTPPLQLTALHYLWCDSDCLNPDADTWGLTGLGLPVYQGEGVDLVLDSANHPRLVYEMGGEGLGYAWCNGNCETASGWQSSQVESTSDIISQYPELPKYSCPIQTWFNGKRPSLALDSVGNPRVGYDAEHWWGGYDVFGTKCDASVPVARFALFNQP